MSDAFLSILRDQRDEMNRRFAAQSQLSGGLDGEGFLKHLAETMAPIVDAVSDVLPECSSRVATELYDLSLELFASNAIGPHAATREIQRVWTDILPRIPQLMSRNSAIVAGSLSNAAFNVARADGGRIDFWLREMITAATACDSVSRLLDCGTVLAWRAGMVQYRSAAIEAAAGLPHPLAVITLGLADDTGAAGLPHVLDHLRRSPWHAAELPESPHDPPTQVARTLGEFRGFGGQFLRPPIVAADDDDLFVTDENSTWKLLADCYGSLLHRVGGRDAFPKTRRAAISARDKFPELAESASSAHTRDTLAVTYGDSHRIVVRPWV